MKNYEITIRDLELLLNMQRGSYLEEVVLEWIEEIGLEEVYKQCLAYKEELDKK